MLRDTALALAQKPGHSWIFSLTAAAVVVCSIGVAAQTQVSLSPATSPSNGQAGVTTINVTGSNFPAGTISPAQVQVSLRPATPGAGPSGSTVATAVMTIIGTTRRVAFTMPPSMVVSSPTSYVVSLSGATTSGVSFASRTTASLTVNPAAFIASASPAAGLPGQTRTVTLTGGSTDFLQGSTQASFGSGVSVGTGAAGGFGFVTVNSRTSATAQLTIAGSAVVGNRSIVIRTGSQQASLTDGFAILQPPPPQITAVALPSRNSAGWNNTNVTVTFTCTSSGVPLASCSPSATVSTEGASQVVTGRVVDVGGNSASAVVALNIDKTPPSVVITSPEHDAALFSARATALGTAADTLSGISRVSCNGAPALLANGVFACGVDIGPGGGAIAAVATDVAGNARTSIPVEVTVLPTPVVSLTAPANLSFMSISPVMVRGTVNDPSVVVNVNGIPAPVSAGSFSLLVPLTEGTNTLTAVAANPGGNTGSASVAVTLDTTPPHISIDTPRGSAMTTDAAIAVSGTVNDIVVGTVNEQDAQVTVNGITAHVANRTYSVPAVPLALGPNTVQVIARDRVGNTATDFITMTRVSATDPPAPAIGEAVITRSLSVVSGNGQTAAIGAQLPSPLIVVLRDASGSPLANQPVVFRVTGNSGLVTSGGTTAASAAVMTDTNGQAPVLWTLGQRSGAGINSVQASAALTISPVDFTATALTGPASHIVIDSGDNQTGIASQPLTFPLVTVVTDAGHNRVPNVPVTFTVASGGGTLGGTASQVVTTDSDGRALVLFAPGPESANSTHLVEATFVGNPGTPATFLATAKAAGDPAATRISGVVLDNSDHPIPDVTIRLYRTNQGSNNNLPLQVGTPVTTDARGAFLIQGAPIGYFKLMADGSTATAGEKRYPTLEYSLVTVAGQDNTVGMPIYLPPLDTQNRVCVSEANGGTLTLPESPGFALTIGAGSATFPGGSRTGCVTVTTVNPEKVPMAPGFGQQPRFIVSIQPAGTKFNPPAPITFPNVDGLAPRAITEMYSYDHDLSMFVAIGTGIVSDDGSVIASGLGAGVLKAGWHCGGNPNTTGSVATCDICQKCEGNKCLADPSRDGQTCEPGNQLGQSTSTTSTDLNLSFNNGADTVRVVIGASCRADRRCAAGACVAGPQANGFNVPDVSEAVSRALTRIFDNTAETSCIEAGLRAQMQTKLKGSGLIIACRPDEPGQVATCADTVSLSSNNMLLKPGSFTGACGPMASTLLHEMVHGAGGDPGAPDLAYHNGSLLSDCRDRAYGCEESCFPQSTGSRRGNLYACVVPPSEFTPENMPNLECNPCQIVSGKVVCTTR